MEYMYMVISIALVTGCSYFIVNPFFKKRESK